MLQEGDFRAHRTPHQFSATVRALAIKPLSRAIHAKGAFE